MIVSSLSAAYVRDDASDGFTRVHQYRRPEKTDRSWRERFANAAGRGRTEAPLYYDIALTVPL